MAKKNAGKPKGKLIWKILCGVFAFLFVFLLIAGPIANNRAISGFSMGSGVTWSLIDDMLDVNAYSGAGHAGDGRGQTHPGYGR